MVALLAGGLSTHIAGPPFKATGYIPFKEFRLAERFNLQFRSEFFNILNHPNFNAPGFGGNGVMAIAVPATSPVRTSAKSARLAMLPMIRDRSSSL